MKILLTGATGFIGKGVLEALRRTSYSVRVALRSLPSACSLDGVELVVVGDIGPDTDWTRALDGVDAVIHLAAVAHINVLTEDQFPRVHKANVQAVRQLAVSAVRAGVRRFVFMSSVAVHGGGIDRRYSEMDMPAPENFYGQCKLEAEEVLRKISAESGLELVILRPPLVYGPGAKANFGALIKLATSGLPLPLKGIRNSRSFIYLGNLIDVMLLTLVHPAAVGQTFLLSDGQDVSTAKLIEIIALSSGRKVCLFDLPFWFLKGIFGIIGKGVEWEKLTGSFAVDSTKIRRELGWTPPYTLEQGIRATVTGEKI